MVAIAQLVRVADCGSVGRGFEPHWPPQEAGNISGLLLLEGRGTRGEGRGKVLSLLLRPSP